MEESIHLVNELDGIIFVPLDESCKDLVEKHVRLTRTSTGGIYLEVVEDPKK